jgi:hypothetical protein
VGGAGGGEADRDDDRDDDRDIELSDMLASVTVLGDRGAPDAVALAFTSSLMDNATRSVISDRQDTACMFRPLRTLARRTSLPFDHFIISSSLRKTLVSS